MNPELLNQIHHADCLEGIKQIPSNSVKCILTDPPYLYLKGQKLEREFDEMAFFRECKRILTDDGFVVLFGRGQSFYRWNYILGDLLGFTFKEEIVWDKGNCSSPLHAISRLHETVSIYTKKNGTINRVKVPYMEMKSHDLDSIIGDVKRMRSILKNTKSLNAVLEYLENNIITEKTDRVHGHSASVQPSNLQNADRSVAVMQAIKNGMNEKTIIRTDRSYDEKFSKHDVSSNGNWASGDRCCNVMNSIVQGMNEKTIIKEGRDHYNTIHPTQKPVRLIERLLALVTKEGDIVCDFFTGSGAIPEACENTNRPWMAWEIDKEYYEGAKARIEAVKKAKAERHLQEQDLFTNSNAA